MDMVVEADRLARRFASVTALAGLNLQIGAGEAVAVLGPNGAGKSTLLRLLGTLLRPTSGTLRLFGHSVSDATAAVRRRIGVLSHQSFLYPDLSPTENLDFYARMFGVHDAGARVRQLLDLVGLVGWAHRPVRTLSRGLEQRCALARAILHQPDLILLDEPFTGLDVDAANTLSSILVNEHKRGTTLLMVTHDLARGLEICRRAVVLVAGELRDDVEVTGGARVSFETRYREIVHSQPNGESEGQGS
ncbi:MAG: heme ABC exporter ATP-binding protein CcmA [Deltaproteobacteria bacterium]|nr:heme ABC exporter ATP-binding protein CcmA [Deltaproteobacteria bacterium]